MRRPAANARVGVHPYRARPSLGKRFAIRTIKAIGEAKTTELLPLGSAKWAGLPCEARSSNPDIAGAIFQNRVDPSDSILRDIFEFIVLESAKSPSRTDPKAAIRCSKERLNSQGSSSAGTWPLPLGKSNPIESQEAGGSPDPKITILGLSHREDCAIENPLLISPSRVGVLCQLQRWFLGGTLQRSD